jgi:hypothetical protein
MSVPSLALCFTDKLADPRKPDVAAWREIYKLIPESVPTIDRCGHLTLPYNFCNLFPMPEVPDRFSKTYHEIGLARARELLDYSQQQQKPLLFWYSGGIDSTLVAVCLLQVARPAELESIKLALTDHSVAENPAFYYNHLRGKFELVSGERILNLINSDAIAVSGELNDQIFGTDIYSRLIQYHSFDFLFEPYNETNITGFLTKMGLSLPAAKIWYAVLAEQIASTRRCEITTVKDFFWWYNFCYKWQSVQLRAIMRSQQDQPVSLEFLRSHVKHFFDTPDFQYWSMSNPDKKIRKNWAGYKYTAKDVIYEYTGDQDYYNNKVKVGSLINVLRQRQVPDGYEFSNGFFTPKWQLDPGQYYNPENSFAKW